MIKTFKKITATWNWYVIGALIALAFAWVGLYYVCKWTIQYLWAAPKGVF